MNALQKASDYRMQIKWNRKTQEWFQRASDYTGFHKELAKILTEHLGDARTMCDFGCGAGNIDLELKNRMREITCVDSSPVVVHLLERRLQEQAVTNIKTVCCDMNDADGCWDAGVLLFVGASPETLLRLLSRVNDRLIVIDRGGCINNPMVGERARKEHSLLPLINCFFRAGICCEISDYCLEYGQPFVSMKEVYEYVGVYHKNKCNETIPDYVKRCIIKTGRRDYPYYMPYQKNFGVFVITKEDNMELLEKGGYLS